MSKQTAIRLPEELAQTLEVSARIKGVSFNQIVITALTDYLARLGSDDEFQKLAFESVARDRALLKRMAQLDVEE